MDRFRNIKVITLGPAYAGKTSILLRATVTSYIADQQYKPTIGVDFKIRECKVGDKEIVKMHIWDTAGQERFQQINRMYYRDVDAALFIFDLSSAKSFQTMDYYWSDFGQFRQPDRRCFCILVGNKNDLQQREVTQQDARGWAEDKGIPYIEVSAKSGNNVESLFDQVLRETVARGRQRGANTSSILQRSPPKKKRRAC